jgi:hypothetical protein
MKKIDFNTHTAKLVEHLALCVPYSEAAHDALHLLAQHQLVQAPAWPASANFTTDANLVIKRLIQLGDHNLFGIKPSFYKSLCSGRRDHDPIEDSMAVIFKGIHESFGETKWSASNLVALCSTNNDLNSAFDRHEAPPDTGSTRSLGHWLTKHALRTHAGLMLVPQLHRSGAFNYCFKSEEK